MCAGVVVAAPAVIKLRTATVRTESKVKINKSCRVVSVCFKILYLNRRKQSCFILFVYSLKFPGRASVSPYLGLWNYLVLRAASAVAASL